MNTKLLKTIRQVLFQNPSVVFAYLYGSFTDAGAYNDIDIAVYAATDCDPFTLSADLKITLAEKTGKSPDTFDVRVINHLLRKGDLFALLFLRDVLSRGELLIDNSFQDRASFIEAFSMKYRECEGLIAEVCMKVDSVRLKKYLADIVRSANELKKIIEQNSLELGTIELKAAKYILIELAEAMSNTLQHVLAKQKGIAVSGYIDTIVKGRKEGIISEGLFQKLKPFFDFRNSLVHRYWIIDDEKLIANIEAGRDDFDQFADELENYIQSIR